MTRREVVRTAVSASQECGGADEEATIYGNVGYAQKAAGAKS
jgi:hypothetical protein